MSEASRLIGNGVSNDEADRDLDEQEKISRAVMRVNNWFDYFDTNIQMAREDIYFAVVNQWDSDLFATRSESNKACLQVNYIYAIIAALVGQYRKQTPEFKVYTMTDQNNPNVKINQDVLDLYDNLMRQIFFDNKSEIIFQQAGESALLRGFGAVAVYIDYENDMSFHQVPKLRNVEDPLMSFFDPDAKEATKSDGRYCGEVITYTVQEFKDKFPDSIYAKTGIKPTSFKTNKLERRNASFWSSEDWVRVANYYVKESYPKKIALLSDGRTMTVKEAKIAVEEERLLAEKVKRKEGLLKKKMISLGFSINDKSHFDNHIPLSIVDTRDTIDYRIMNYLMTDNEILEESEWPSKVMPIIFIDGHSQFLDGQQYTKSYHRTAKDAQRVLNYTASEAIENLMSSHKEQWLGTPENFAGHEGMWRNPSNSVGALMANRDEGQMPIKIDPPQISPSFLQLFNQSAQDINATLGYFEANQGAQGNEQSGVAINNRAKQGAMANFVYYDNWGRMIEQVSKCIMSLIPSLYDTTRNIIVRNKSGDQKTLTINNPSKDGDAYDNDLSQGNVSVEVTVGSNYEIQKQENMDSLKDLMATGASTNPQLVGALFDLYAANTNLENTPQIVERIRKVQSGENIADILREEMDEPAKPQQPNPQEQMMQMDAQIKMQQIELQKGDQQIRMKELELQQVDQQIKMAQLQNEQQKTLIAKESNDVKRYEADKSLEEIKISSGAEMYNSDADVLAARLKAASDMHRTFHEGHNEFLDINLRNRGVRNTEV